jgi:hypothetical protein
MAEIVHRVRVRAPRDDVHRAVCDEALRAAFWPEDAPLAMRVVAVEDGTRVAWRCLEGPPEWDGTDILFDVVGEGAETVVRFRHRNWKEATDFMADCATTWARVLLGLKAHLETPEADDVLL